MKHEQAKIFMAGEHECKKLDEMNFVFKLCV